MSEVIRPKDRYVQLELGINRERRNCKVNWIEDIGEGFYLFGVTYEAAYSGDPYGTGSGVWMMYFSDTQFKPLFDTSQISIEGLKMMAKRIIFKEEKEGDNKGNDGRASLGKRKAHGKS